MDEKVLWALTGALLLRAGLAIHAAGMCRAKNAAGALMRHLCDLCLAVLAFWAVGFAIYSSQAAVIDIDWRSLFGPKQNLDGAAAFTAAMILIATGIVPGVLAERARFWPSLVSSILL